MQIFWLNSKTTQIPSLNTEFNSNPLFKHWKTQILSLNIKTTQILGLNIKNNINL